MPTLHFLEADVPLTKSYTQDAAGTISKTSYPFTWEFSSHAEEVKDLAQFESALRKHAALGHCLLKGQLGRPLVKESRAGSTVTGQDTEFLVLDLDGLAVKSVDDFLSAIGLGDTSHIVQWSASYGIGGSKDLRCHVFFLLDRPYAAPLLKQWLIQVNHATPLLADAMSLTKTGNAISWPLDISACQNDKLIYIAPPVLKNLKDPVAKGKRIQLVRRAKPLLNLSGTINSTDKNKALTTKRIAQLREAAGLPERKITYKMHGTVEVMVKPDACVITEMKAERGFVYFNLNGGDSWAYYHPENNPDYIYSFKGETAYLTKELLPDYWAQISSQPKVSSNGDLYLAFCDRNTGVYWRGTYNEHTDVLDIRPAKNETQLRHFAKQHGVPLGDFIPEWDLTFDPHDNVRVDPTNHTVNTFQPSPYMLAAPKKVRTPPPTIYKVIHHALGSVPEITERYLNWLAAILQTRDKTLTAWVLHGVPGTGKGTLLSHILRPLFGPKQVVAQHMESLNEPYNHWLKDALICVIDEVQTRALNNEGVVMAKLRVFITEKRLAIREMYAGAVERRSYCNMMLFSNQPDPVNIPRNDRRMNVAKYQTDRLVLTDAEFAQIEEELQAFHDYLINFKVDMQAARTPMETEDRNTLISISESSADSVAGALLTGDFEFFVDQLPTDENHQSNARDYNRVENYKAALRDVLGWTDPATGKCAIPRDTLFTLFNYCVGNMPDTPNKFTSFLKHHRIYVTKVWHQNRTVNGVKVEFQDISQWPTYQTQIDPPKPVASAPKKLARVK